MFGIAAGICFIAALCYSFGRLSQSQDLENRRANLVKAKWEAEVSAFGWSDSIDPIEFERRCAEAMRLAGWVATTTKGSGDQGVDVIAVRNGKRLVLQCKKYGHTVGNKAVQEVIAGRIYAGADYAAVVSNAGYSSGAVDIARKADVLLLHFTDLRRINSRVGFADVDCPSSPDVARLEVETDSVARRYQRGKRVAPLLWAASIVLFFVAIGSSSDDPENTALGTSRAQPVTGTEPAFATALVLAPASPTRAATAPASAVRRSAHKLRVSAQIPAYTVLCADESDYELRQQDMERLNPTHKVGPSCFYIEEGAAFTLLSSHETRARVKITSGDHAGAVAWTEAAVVR